MCSLYGRISGGVVAFCHQVSLLRAGIYVNTGVAVVSDSAVRREQQGRLPWICWQAASNGFLLCRSVVQGIDFNFIELLRDYIDKLYNSRKMDIVVLGDFNINFLNNDVHTKRLLNLQNEFFLKQTVEGPTRCDEMSKIMIDLIY